MDWLTNWEAIAGLVAGGVGAVTGVAALIVKAKESRRASKVAEAANVITGYARLCDELQQERQELLAEIKCLRAEQSENRAKIAKLESTLHTMEAERDKWETERAHLTAQIAGLEAKNKELEERIGELQARRRR